MSRLLRQRLLVRPACLRPTGCARSEPANLQGQGRCGASQGQGRLRAAVRWLVVPHRASGRVYVAAPAIQDRRSTWIRPGSTDTCTRADTDANTCTSASADTSHVAQASRRSHDACDKDELCSKREWQRHQRQVRGELELLAQGTRSHSIDHELVGRGGRRQQRRCDRVLHRDHDRRRRW